MNLRFIGGVLLIAGTSIGGGMLALPIANASLGFFPSSLFLIVCWFITLLGALYILEVNLYLPRGNHMLSMATLTLGKSGLVITWLSYLILLYTLLAAYISGGSDVFGFLFEKIGFHLTSWQTSLLFTLFFGLIVYGGIRRVDFVNRAFMLAKLGTYLFLVILIAPKITATNYSLKNFLAVQSIIMILITSFGFAIIVPNLREYFDDNIALLKKVIFIGSLIPLVCYLAWDAVILGTLPLKGAHGLDGLIHSPRASSELATLLSEQVNSSVISSLFNFFSSICMLTAFLGVSLCLLSFLADGIKVEQKGYQGLGLFLLTFFPPLILVIFYPGVYIQALNYAGFICVILLLLLPVLMSMKGRPRFASRYRVPGGALTQKFMIVISLLLLIVAFMDWIVG